MGRYYNGDIEGKFWFGVQDSNDADFFGSTGYEPNYLQYYFNKEEHSESINNGIKKCLVELGEYKEAFDKFFDLNNGYNDEMLIKQLKKPMDEIKAKLEWYSRLRLGIKIRDCVEKTDYCEFQAEC